MSYQWWGSETKTRWWAGHKSKLWERCMVAMLPELLRQNLQPGEATDVVQALQNLVGGASSIADAVVELSKNK